MGSKAMIRYDEQLTKAARRIFGNVVIKAYRAALCYGISDEYLEDALDNCSYITNENSIECESDPICIEFVSESFVEFATSEWLEISRKKISDNYYYSKKL